RPIIDAHNGVVSRYAKENNLKDGNVVAPSMEKFLAKVIRMDEEIGSTYT
ncbi:28053_t:CDS:1, partial [Dentiscutata erythropus]